MGSLRIKHGALHLTLLLALFLPCVSSAQRAETPYSRKFAEIQTRAGTATPTETAVLVTRAYELRDKVADPREIANFLTGVADDARQHALVRDLARWYLGQIAIHQNQQSEAQKQFDQLGYIRTWSIAGPFPSISAEWSLNQEFGPERGFRADAEYATDGRRVRWSPLRVAGAQPWIDFTYSVPEQTPAVVFVSTTVESPTAQAVALRFTTENPVAIFVNGTRTFVETAPSKLAPDQHSVAVQLQPGWNSLVLKLIRTSDAGDRFAVRVTGLKGERLQLAAAAREATAGPGPAICTALVAEDLVATATRDAADNSPEHLEMLSALEALTHRGDALEHIDAAARRLPTAARWFEVSRACGDATCRFQALSQALRLDSAFQPAIVALADYYFGRNQKTKARELLDEAVRRDPSDFVARSRFIDLLVASGSNTAALERSRALETEFSPAPLWLRRELAARYEDLNALDAAVRNAEEVLAQQHDSSDMRALLVRIAERRHDSKTLMALLATAAAVNPYDPSALTRAADLALQAGDVATAQRDFAAALERAPLDAELRQTYAAVLARRGEQSHATRELAVANNLRVADVRAATAANAADVDREFMVDASALAAKAREQKPADGATAESLADIRVERLQPSGLSSVHVQQVVYIHSDHAAREYATQHVRFSPETQQLDIIRARVLKANGGEEQAEDDGEATVAEAGAAMYYDVRARQLHFPSLEPGDALELEYRVTPRTVANPYGEYFGDFVTFGANVSQHLKRFVLIAPSYRDLHVVAERLEPAHVRQTSSERTYVWEARNLPPLPDEPRGPALTEIAPYVHVSTFGSWEELGNWYARLIRPQFALDANLRQVADRLIADKKSDLDKVTAIHEFVLRNTHYVALEFGIYSYKPYPVTQTYARRFGDCKDKASLIVALLRYAGIDAEIALVRTRRLGRMHENATSISVFNHAIAHVPQYNLWLDGTAEYAGLRELPLEDQGAMALTVALDGRATLRTIPTSRPEDNYTRRAVRVQLHNDGRMDFNGTNFVRGEDAPGLRREYEVAERQRDSVRERLAEVFPTVRVEDVQVVNGAAELQRDVEVNFRGTLDTFAGRDVIPLQASWLPRSVAQSLAVLTSRKVDVVLPAPWTSDEELRFAMPNSAVLEDLPADTKLETPFGSASVHYERRGRELIIRTTVQFTKLRIAPAEYPQFRTFCQQIERALRAEVKVRLNG